MTPRGRRVRAQRRRGDSPLWRRKALAAWSAVIRRYGKCDMCGDGSNPSRLNAHHVLPKERYGWLALEVENGVALCPLCHKMGRYAAHRNALYFAEWLRNSRPAVYAWAMQHMHDEPRPCPDFRARYEQLAALLKGATYAQDSGCISNEVVRSGAASCG